MTSKFARKTPSGGSRPDKIMRDALMLELAEEVRINDGPEKGKAFKKLRLVTRTMVNEAIKGDASLIKEIFDRVDGKVTLKVGGDADAPPVKYELAVDDDTKAAADAFDPAALAKLTADELVRLYFETIGETPSGEGKAEAGGAGNRKVQKGRKVPRR